MISNDLLFDQIIRIKIQLRALIIQHYLHYEQFGLVWWMGIACIIILPFIWWKMVDKKRLLELCLFGLIMSFGAAILDVIGSQMVLWQYHINILLPVSMLLPVNFVIVPAINIIVYQKCPQWGRYITVCMIIAAFLAFGLEPFAVWIGQYKLISWRYIYSFPIYLVINIIAKILTERLKKVQGMSKISSQT